MGHVFAEHTPLVLTPVYLTIAGVGQARVGKPSGGVRYAEAAEVYRTLTGTDVRADPFACFCYHGNRTFSVRPGGPLGTG